MLIRVSGHKHNGAIIWLDVDRHDTVRKLKLMIQDSPEMRRIPAYHQHLKHGRNGNVVGAVRPTVSFPADDQLPLANYGIADGSKLYLSRSRGCPFFEILVEMVDGRMEDIISLHVSFDDTVFAIKMLIEEKRSIPVIRQSLSFEGRPLDDMSTLRNCRIFAQPSTPELQLARKN